MNDISALALLLNRGAQIRGVRNLHAKLYLFGPRAVVTSANLTEAALLRNHEFGFVAEDPDIAQCNGYFEKLWAHAGPDLTASRLSDWQRQLTAYLSSGARAPGPGLGDEGVDAGVAPDAIVLPAWVASAEQAFVKFFGESDNRAARSMPVFEEVERSGSHWACTYPNNKRPDGSAIFAIGAKTLNELVRFDLKRRAYVKVWDGMPATDVSFSKDGAWAALANYPEFTLSVIRADGSGRAQLTWPPLVVHQPHWSPDGKQIAFMPGKIAQQFGKRRAPERHLYKCVTKSVEPAGNAIESSSGMKRQGGKHYK